jgi:hypothetical protein
MYKLNRIEGTDIFFLSNSSIKTLGETLTAGTFQEVLAVAETLKDTAVDVGSGDLVSIENPVLELTNITDARWFLLVLSDRYQIVRTSGNEVYNLPTNALEGSGQGSLESIFNKIIELEL